jgi:sugar phosphate isomerase/epimerase
MSRPITLFTGQWADLPLEEVARLASGWGYDGLEIACWGDHLDPWQAADSDSYVQGKLDLLDRYQHMGLMRVHGLPVLVQVKKCRVLDALV